MYEYKATIQSVYDGDTIRADIDLGFGVIITGNGNGEQLRLLGIDAPEVRGAEREQGLITRDWLREILPKGKEVTIRTKKDSKGKYGRYLAEIFVTDFPSMEGVSVNVNKMMVQLGYAEHKNY